MGGAGGPVTFRHVVEYRDGWMPIHGRKQIQPKLRCSAGRQAAGAIRPRSAWLFACRPRTEILDDYIANGFSRVVLGLPQGSAEALAALDSYAPGRALQLNYAALPSPGPSGLCVPRSAEPGWNRSTAIGIAWSIVVLRVASWTQVR